MIKSLQNVVFWGCLLLSGVATATVTDKLTTNKIASAARGIGRNRSDNSDVKTAKTSGVSCNDNYGTGILTPAVFSKLPDGGSCSFPASGCATYTCHHSGDGGARVSVCGSNTIPSLKGEGVTLTTPCSDIHGYAAVLFSSCDNADGGGSFLGSSIGGSYKTGHSYKIIAGRGNSCKSYPARYGS